VACEPLTGVHCLILPNFEGSHAHGGPVNRRVLNRLVRCRAVERFYQVAAAPSGSMYLTPWAGENSQTITRCIESAEQRYDAAVVDDQGHLLVRRLTTLTSRRLRAG
jgi:hypothetical protein